MLEIKVAQNIARVTNEKGGSLLHKERGKNCALVLTTHFSPLKEREVKVKQMVTG